MFAIHCRYIYARVRNIVIFTFACFETCVYVHSTYNMSFDKIMRVYIYYNIYIPGFGLKSYTTVMVIQHFIYICAAIVCVVLRNLHLYIIKHPVTRYSFLC